MKNKEIKQIAETFGWVLDKDDKQQRLMRFRPEEGGPFIDVWNGKKGLTVGVFQEETSKVRYGRHLEYSDLVDVFDGRYDSFS